MKFKRKMRKLVVALLCMGLLFSTVSTVQAQANPSAMTPAADLRADLDHLLSEHFVLAVMTLTTSYDETEDAEDVRNALEQNAKDMTPAIASVYDEESAAEFERIFTEHNEYADDYAVAAKEDDQALRKQAEKDVESFVEEFSTFLDSATEGNLPKEAAAEALSVHEKQVVNTFDHYVAGDYEAAYQEFREGYSHMYTISEALSTAITTQMPEMFEDTKADAPAADLRSDLNSLAGEHFALATMGMMKGVDQAEDYDYVTWAEDENTADFKEAISSIYGEEGATQFEEVWQSDHINAQADVVASAIEGNEADMQDAEDRLLNGFPNELGAFLAEATEGNLPEDAAVETLNMHEQQVLDTFHAYHDGDYEMTYENFREGYQFMFGVGMTLGDAIVMQMPADFEGTMMPEEMPETGMGGASETSGFPMMTWALLGSMVLLASGSLLFIYRKTSNQK